MLSSTVPTCVTYDPAYVYELAVVVQDGMRRMYEKGEDCFYYITMYNEDYAMPAMPEGSAEGILRGIYKLKPAEGGAATAQLFGSGPILNEVLRAQEILADEVQRARGCVERDELQRAAARCAGGGALEPAASGGEGAGAVSGRRRWAVRRGRSLRRATT